MARISRVVHRELLGNDKDLFEVRIDADQLGDSVPSAGGRQVDDAAIEAVTGIEALTHVVKDRDIADWGLQNLPAAPGRGAEHDVAAGVGVSHRGDFARFAAENIENADPILAGRDLRERADPDIVFEISDTGASHRGNPCA